MHKPAKMLSIILQQILLALVLTLSNPFSQSPCQPLIVALPITSKPIENTAENLAWQAWIMLPPQQQNLEKSRKVTPKSIFILPNRVQLPHATTGSNGYPPTDGGAQFMNGEMGSGGYAPIDCPPGQRQFESRCIPTVDIDREQLLIQELQILIQQGGQGGNNQGPSEYDYDYDDDSMGVGNFEPPLMLNGGVPPIAIGTNYDDADRLPIEDAPLKFNIFRDKFPTDGGASAAENSNETSAVFDPMVMMENGTIPEGWKAVNITNLWTDLASKFQMENGDEPAGSFFPVALNRADETTSSTTTTTTESTTTKSKSNNTQSFALSDIDAIMLPAATTMQSQHQQHHQHHHQHHQQHANKQQQEFAIFKDDSAMQLIAIEGDRLSTQQQQQKATEIMELLKVDALLPLQHVATGTTVTRSTVTPLPFFSVNAVDKDVAAPVEVEAEVTTTTTFPTPLAETIAEVETHASQEREKEERTRSVTMRMLEDDADNTLTTTDEIESNLSTTTTTSFTTIDDELSTIPSNNDATSLQLNAVADPIIQQEIVAVTEQEDPAHEVRKKSKVEPVGVDLFDAAAAADGDEQTTPLPTPPEFDMLVVPAEEVEAEIDSENALNNVAGAAGVADSNRFTEKTTVTVVGAPTALNNEVASVESEAATTTTTTVPAAEITTTTMTATSAQSSEIDIAAELRLINELVKGKRQDTTTTTTVTTSTTDTTTTTTTAKSNIAPIKDFKDPRQETTAATSAKTLPTTMINADAETTTTTTPTSSTTPSDKSLAAIESAGNIMMTDTEAESKSNMPTATATTESTATIWSKILPFLSFGSTTTITTPTTADEALSSSSGSSDTAENSSSNSVRSPANRRNSKIIRINNLSTNEVEQSSNIETTTTMDAASSTTTTTTTELPSTTTQSTIDDDTSSSTFWWLPIGWSLERNADAATQPVVTPFRTYKNAVTPAAASSAAVQPAQSLLLRFWNAFPGNQKRS